MNTTLNEMLELAEVGRAADFAVADEKGWMPAVYAEQFNPERFDFVWNYDYTLFRALPLRWWDDASYARYQSDVEDWDVYGEQLAERR
jgi:hypothetical protein